MGQGGIRMKFEEVLPKMRDEGRVGIRKGRRHKFEKGVFVIEYPLGGWSEVYIGAPSLTEDDWTIEPVKVKKWQWVFGSGVEGESSPRIYLTEEGAEAYLQNLMDMTPEQAHIGRFNEYECRKLIKLLKGVGRKIDEHF
jgi:hypothetical protein